MPFGQMRATERVNVTPSKTGRPIRVEAFKPTPGVGGGGLVVARQLPRASILPINNYNPFQTIILLSNLLRADLVSPCRLVSATLRQVRDAFLDLGPSTP